ncbi:MAG: hypothetical protein QM831_03580 [Kofleriaceae bacterium]
MTERGAAIAFAAASLFASACEKKDPPQAKPVTTEKPSAPATTQDPPVTPRPSLGTPTPEQAAAAAVEAPPVATIDAMAGPERRVLRYQRVQGQGCVQLAVE